MKCFCVLIFALFIFENYTAQNKTLYYNRKLEGVKSTEDYEFKKIIYSRKQPKIDSIIDYYRNGKVKAKYQNAIYIDSKNDIYSIYKGKVSSRDSNGSVIHEFVQDLDYDKIQFYKDSLNLSAILYKRKKINYWLSFPDQKSNLFSKIFIFDSIDFNMRGRRNSTLKTKNKINSILLAQSNYLEVFDFENRLCRSPHYFCAFNFNELDSNKKYQIGIVYNFTDFNNYSEVIVDNNGKIHINTIRNGSSKTKYTDSYRFKGADHSMQIEFYDGFIYFEDESEEGSRRILAIDEMLSNTILGYKILYTESNALQLNSFTISCGMAWYELERFIR